MILALDANGLVRTMYHMAETKDPPDAVERFLNRLCHLDQWAKILAKRIKEPLTLLACFDCEGQCFRHSILPEYKANREPDPLAYEAVSHAAQALENADDWHLLISPDGYEADDLIASIAYQRKFSEHIIIHSADKDFNQCLHADRVGIIKRSGIRDVPSNPPELPVTEFFANTYTALMLSDEYGFPPRCWVDYQCLVGDQSDNVTGADGIGPVKAKEILQIWPWDLHQAQLDKFNLNQRQLAGWPGFLDRFEKLRRVLTLKNDLTLEHEKWTSTQHSPATT